MRHTTHHRSPLTRVAAILAVAATLTFGVAVAVAAEPPRLGTAANYAVMGATAITNTGPTVINGNMAISPSNASSVTGFPVPGTVTGEVDAANADAVLAHTDLVTAYNDAAAEPVTVDLTGTDLGGLTLTPGVYQFDSSAQLTGLLTLDGQGSTNATFIFQIGSTLTTASAARVRLINGAGACAVFWQVGSSATLGTTTSFQGTIMALTSITMNTGATIGVGGIGDGGRALAMNGAVTLDSNVITPPPAGCAFTAAPSVPASPSVAPSTPGGTTTGGSPAPSLPNAAVLGGAAPMSATAVGIMAGMALMAGAIGIVVARRRLP
jgi:hypothetical protein